MLVSGGLSFASVSADGSVTCGVTTARDAYCWGNNSSGQLGDDPRTNRHTPVPVAGGLSFASRERRRPAHLRCHHRRSGLLLGIQR